MPPMIVSTGFGTESVIAARSSGLAPSSTQAKNRPPFAGDDLGELLAHGLHLGPVGVREVDRLGLRLLVVEVRDRDRPQVLHRGRAAVASASVAEPSRNAVIAARVVASASAIRSCSSSKVASSSLLTPIDSIAGQAISCSPSWWTVSWASKLSHAVPSCAARVVSPSRNARESVEEPVEVAAYGAVDHLVHAHGRHGLNATADAGFCREHQRT